MNLYYAIKILYPDILDKQFILQDDGDGKGPYIFSWDYPSNPPTQDQLNNVADQSDQNAQTITDGISALNYLSSTDWYASRKADTDVAIPSDISTAREDARAKVRAAKNIGFNLKI